MKIAVIGAGNMGGALIKGWAKSGLTTDLIITAQTKKTLDRVAQDYPDITTMLDNVAAVAEADIVVLAVKPWLVQQVIAQIQHILKDKLLISVAAGI